MYKFLFTLSFFLLSFQSFYAEGARAEIAKLFDNDIMSTYEGNKIEIKDNAFLEIKYQDNSSIKISFSSGLLYPNYIFLKGIKTLMFQNCSNICVSCEELHYFPKKAAVKLSGRVLLTINRKGIMLNLSSIFIDLKTKRAFSNERFVGSFSNGSKIFGSAFEFNLNNGEYEIKDMKSEINKRGFNFSY